MGTSPECMLPSCSACPPAPSSCRGDSATFRSAPRRGTRCCNDSSGVSPYVPPCGVDRVRMCLDLRFPEDALLAVDGARFAAGSNSGGEGLGSKTAGDETLGGKGASCS
mmetsp:Transcript_164485/g.315897  ORF Transcript_164485/g.315897 Transcript_164485/m.315897 type:complete len:109 (+) Transcript_164485:25-351(+)